MIEATGIIDTIVFWLAWILGAVAFFLAVYFFMIVLQYKHTIIVREVLNKRKIITIDKFRVFTDPKTGIEWYKLKRFNQQIPVAPQEALEVTRKGRMICEAYRLPSGDILYLKDDTTDIDNIDQKDNFKPITTSQRVVQYHLYENKMKFKRKTWKDLIIPIVGILALTTIVIALMVFWGDLASPILEVGDKLASITAQQGEITETLQEIIQEKQIIEDEPAQGSAPN